MALERRIATLVAGTSSGWILWAAALRGLELAAERSRAEGRGAFTSWPRGELDRLLVDVEEALDMATLAVDLREVLLGDEDLPESHARESVAELLLERARELQRARGLPFSNAEYGVGGSAPR